MVSDPRQRSFRAVLVNTLIANITTSFLWYCVTFWMYLETRNVLVTAILGGSYMLGMALFGVPFGSWIDRTRKKRVMVVSQSVTAVFFALAAIVYFLSPREQLLTIGSFPFVAFVLLLLTGAIMESARGIALGTVVTLLVPDSERAKANGLVGMVGGLGFMITSVIADDSSWSAWPSWASTPPVAWFSTSPTPSIAGWAHFSHFDTNSVSMVSQTLSTQSVTVSNTFPLSPLKSGSRKKMSGPIAPAAR